MAHVPNQQNEAVSSHPLRGGVHMTSALGWVRPLLSLKIFDYRLRLTCAISTTNRPNRSSRIDWRDLNRFRPLQGKNAQSVQIDLVSWSNPLYQRPHRSRKIRLGLYYILPYTYSDRASRWPSRRPSSSRPAPRPGRRSARSWPATTPPGMVARWL